MATIPRLMRKLGKKAYDVYIVGGYIRDRVLGREAKDYDFAVLGDAEEVAKLAAEVLGGKIVPFMAEKGTYRVLVGEEILDFTNLRGENIQQDLAHRDFTMNAMALRLKDYFEFEYIIDPFGGLEDIKSRKIKHVADYTFREDPLRALRAVRFAATYKFDIEEETKKKIKEEAHLLKNVAPERIMNEIFIIIKEKDSHKYLRIMEEMGLMENIFEEVARLKEVGKCYYQLVNSWIHSIRAVEEYENIINTMRFPKDVTDLLRDYLERPLSSENKVKDIIKLAILFHDIGKVESIYIDIENRLHFYNHEIKGAEMIKKMGTRMKIPRKEINLLKKLILYHKKPLDYYLEGVNNKTLFRFFYHLKDNVIGILLVSLADYTAARLSFGKVEDIPRYENFIIKLLRRYVEFKETEKPLLSPLDIILNFDVKDGKKLGQILYEIRKNRFYGEIKTKEDAIEFIKERMRVEKI
ncbi:CCA tRNA nucleotidyltransferase [Caldanaerobacter sp.]|uniref:CCA tRNA nucleotidyltransferase n=1 Tax=Caldanaerobacter sp. TaxID=2930036 RepID=UPI003C74BC59